MPTPPSGTVTFLFTDLEGSTRLWDEYPDDMAEALARHDRVLRTAIESHGGYVFTTAGDGFAAAFSDPAAACGAAITCQRTLNAQNWGRMGSIAVRVALHTGVADERDGDYFGPALNRCSRILGVGHGEQILLSASVGQLVGHRLAEGAELNDLGEHYLKDLGEPERLFQLVHPALRNDFPPLQSVTDHPNNLPVQLTSFLGREVDLRDVLKRLDDTRLLTLTGVGGSGKTRLALRAAAEVVADYRRGAWFVEFASIGDPNLIVGTIAEALRVPLGPIATGRGRGSLRSLIGFLRDRQLLLVLDNCEHVVTAVAHVVADLLESCPNLTVLATSREGLGLPGESLWQVPSLSLAAAGAEPLESDAVQLFISRAKAVNPAFNLDSTSLAAIAQLCERLDGMPLAIELAAARVSMLTPAQIADRLDDRFRLLTGGARTALPRHQTLEATVDWSYELLAEEERLLFRRLAAFRGGFTLDAAEQIGSGHGVEESEVLDLVGQLVAKSMVVRDEVTGRFEMLETLRQYALRKLTETADADEVRVRHLHALGQLFSDAVPRLRSPEEIEVLHQLQHDHDNLRAALAFGLENGREAAAAELVIPASVFWYTGGHSADAYEWTSRATPIADHIDNAALRGEFHAWAAYAATNWGRPNEATAHVGRATAAAAEAGDPRTVAMARLATAHLEESKMNYDAAASSFYVALEFARAFGDLALIVIVAQGLANLERKRQRLDAAAQLAEEAVTVARVVGAPTMLAWALAFRGPVLRNQGDYQGEVDATSEAYEVFRGVGNHPGMGWALACGAISKTALGDHAGALRDLDRAEQINLEYPIPDGNFSICSVRSWVHRRAGDPVAAAQDTQRGLVTWSDNSDLARMADNIQMIAVEIGEHAEAARLEGWALRVGEGSGAPRPPLDLPDYETNTLAQVAALGEDRYRKLRAEGALMSSAEAVVAIGDVADRIRRAAPGDGR